VKAVAVPIVAVTADPLVKRIVVDWSPDAKVYAVAVELVSVFVTFDALMLIVPPTELAETQALPLYTSVTVPSVLKLVMPGAGVPIAAVRAAALENTIMD
jgi:hypothetical protein